MGPAGPLAATLVAPGPFNTIPETTPAIVILPGSGPTDQNGNSPLGIEAAPYRLLADALAARGYPVVLTDKRGMFASRAAVPDPNDVTIAAYGDDLLAWAHSIRVRLPVRSGTRAVVPLGHSEGGLVALAATPRLTGAQGLILVSSPGRRLGDVLREQLAANPANAPVMEQAMTAIASLEDGRLVDATTLPPALQPLFAPQIQNFLIEAFSYDPAQLIAAATVPTLVIQGTNDLQVVEADAQRLAEASPLAELAMIDGMNHVLKRVPKGDRTANLAAYSNPDLPISPGMVEAITGFLRQLEPR